MIATMRRRLRAGSSLVELLVAMTLLAIIGGAAAAAIRMQTGIQLRVSRQTTAAAQLREAAAPVINDLAMASAAAGDIADGGAQDTTLDVRATVGAGFVCASSADDPRRASAIAVSRRGSGIVAGDTAWLYASGHWHPVRVGTVTRSAAASGFCAQAVSVGAETIQIVVDSSLATPTEGMPMRFSRWIRYSLYRSSDGLTYLGLREWSYALGRLGSVQPVAGPFDPQGSRFLYRDAFGNAIPTPVDAAAAIALVGILLTSDHRGPGLAWTDSVIVALRNRP